MPTTRRTISRKEPHWWPWYARAGQCPVNLEEVVSVPSLLTAVGLGFAFCALPGAVTAQAVRRGVKCGFLAALWLQLGALLGVALWAVVALLSAALLLHNRLARLAFGAAGSIVLLHLMWQALRDALCTEEFEVYGAPVAGDVALGALLSLVNPGAIAFWLGVGSIVLAPENAAPDLSQVARFLMGFLVGALLWSGFLAGLSAWAHRLVSPLFFRLVNLACGLALGVLALKVVWTTLLVLVGGG